VKEKGFINELKKIVGNIDVTNISDSKLLERIVQEFVAISENFWNKYSKYVKPLKILKHGETKSVVEN